VSEREERESRRRLGDEIILTASRVVDAEQAGDAKAAARLMAEMHALYAALCGRAGAA
jgi:hypothetical protein